MGMEMTGMIQLQDWDEEQIQEETDTAFPKCQ